MTQKTLRSNAKGYNDATHNYMHYWDGRTYEHKAEETAIDTLLSGKHFKHALDVGGGYGRLSKYLLKYADEVTLVEPSEQQHDIAKEYLVDSPKVRRTVAQAADIPVADASVDLVLVVRVLHHLPDPTPEFAEIARVLSPGGTFLLEFANGAHFLNRIRFGLKGASVPKTPFSIASTARDEKTDLEFVNHHPDTLIQQLDAAGFAVDGVLSGSNLRSTPLKRLLPMNSLVSIERVLQRMLAPIKFGPSCWLLMHKK
jgi:ubiquinone/menaquinone biosynthesis C-methylase UbiE